MMAHLHSRERKTVYRPGETTWYTGPFLLHWGMTGDPLNRLMESFYTRLREYVLALLEKEKPSILGLSVYTVTLPASLFTFRLAKEIDPGMETVMAARFLPENWIPGRPTWNISWSTPHTSTKFLWEKGKNCSWTTCVETSAAAAVYTLADIDNRLLDLDKFAVPDFSGLELRYYPTWLLILPAVVPLNCTFCSEKVFWGGFRKKKAARIVEELTRLSGQYKTQLFLMTDSLLNPVVTELSAAIIDEGLSFTGTAISGPIPLYVIPITLSSGAGRFLPGPDGIGKRFPPHPGSHG